MKPQRPSSHRSAPPKDGSRKYHDRVARNYDNIYDDPFWYFHDEITWDLIKPHLPRTMPAACADLGCGTGKWGFKLLKSGFDVTFLDHSAAMVEEVRKKLDTPLHAPRARRATLVVGDIIEMPTLPSDTFQLVTAMGDPLSICSDPVRAVREFSRITKSGGIVSATADNQLGAIDHFIELGNIDALESFIKTGKTQWLTNDQAERFELHTFTPKELKSLFESNGFEVLDVTGKTILPVRNNRRLLEDPQSVEKLIALEKRLSKDPASAGRAGHLQVTARKR